MKTILIPVFMILITVLLFSYFAIRIWLKSEINHICKSAVEKYGDDKIEALILLLINESESLIIKNNAVWALGKLQDKRALPVLKSLQTNQGR